LAWGNLTRRKDKMGISSVETVEISEAEALRAAREFAAVLAETPEYRAFDEAQGLLRRDPAAQAALRAFQEKQQDLAWQLQFGLLGDDGRGELRRLQQEMLAQPTVQAYIEAQRQLSLLCQEVAGLVSETVGLNFAASCGPGCC